MLKPLDEHYRDLAEQAASQAEALAAQMNAVVDGEDEDGEPCRDRLCGVGWREGRSVLLFAEPGVTNGRQVIYVDAILALARLIDREHQVSEEPR